MDLRMRLWRLIIFVCHLWHSLPNTLHQCFHSVLNWEDSDAEWLKTWGRDEWKWIHLPSQNYSLQQYQSPSWERKKVRKVKMNRKIIVWLYIENVLCSEGGIQLPTIYNYIHNSIAFIPFWMRLPLFVVTLETIKERPWRWGFHFQHQTTNNTHNTKIKRMRRRLERIDL